MSDFNILNPTPGGVQKVETASDLPSSGDPGELVAVQDQMYKWSPTLGEWVKTSPNAMSPQGDLQGVLRLPGLDEVENRPDVSDKLDTRDEGDLQGAIRLPGLNEVDIRSGVSNKVGVDSGYTVV